MANTISAGVIVTDGKNLLLCHVTGAKHWDLPKGKVEPNEPLIDAAVRELMEETSLVVDPGLLISLGTLSYKKDKDLSLWLWRVDAMPDIKRLVCLSTFDSGKNVFKTEMDAFASVPWPKIKKFVVPAMLAVLTRVKDICT